jgi:hypothetical protein
MNYRDLIQRLRREAEFLRRHGAIEAAATKDEDANIIEQFDTQYRLEALSLEQAAAESGYSAAHLGDLVRSKELENVGEPRSPRIRREDLPHKGKRRAQGPDLLAAARGIQSSGEIA